MNKKFLIFMLLALQMPLAFALESPDIFVGGLEVDKLLNLGSALLATVLCVLTAVAYKRTRNARLLYVSIAFGIFALKGFILSAELLFGDWPLADVIASTMDFAILLTFFIGIMKR